MVRFFKSGFAKFKKYEDERGGGTRGHKGSGSRGSRGSKGHKGSGARGSRGSKGHKGSGSRGSRGSKGHKGSGSRGSRGSKGHKGSGSRGSRGSKGHKGSGSRGSRGSKGHKGSGSRGSRGSKGHKGSGSRGSRGSKGHKGSGSRGSRGSKGHKGSGSRGSCGSKGGKGSKGDDKPPEDKGPDVTQLKFFYSTFNEDGSNSELSEEGFFQFVTVELPEGSTFDDIPLEDATDMVLTDLEERGVEVGEIYQVTVVGTDADGNEAFFDFNLVDDGEGNLSLEPKNEDADLFASLSTGDADEQDAPQDDEEEDEDQAAWA